MTLVLTNAAIVLADRVLHGSVAVQGGIIVEILDGRAVIGTDLEGDFLLPGAIDLHTDNLERQVEPRPGARWPSRAALLAHDAHCAAAGVTTVFDALCVGTAGLGEDRPRTCAEGVADLDALVPTGLLRAEHFLHLRCELPASDLPAQMARYLDHPLLRMVSLMDHTPGLGQFGDMARYRERMRREGKQAEAVQAQIDSLRAQRACWRDANRRDVIDALRGRRMLLASHDDATEAGIEENAADAILVSEFPVNAAAARAARRAGMAVIAGAPNLVRGGSHSGNVAVADLLAAGLVDVLASDYVPASLVHAAFIAAATLGLPASVALISSAPARLAGLADRGSIAPGLRADLVRVRVQDGLPAVRQVWRGGERVA